MRQLNLMNKTFNKLTVTGYVKGSQTKKAKWLCVCECGNTRLVDSYSLTQEVLKNCGKCHEGNRGKYGDLTGLTFGKWFIEKLYGVNKYNKPMYWCRCECGTEKPVTKQSLINGSSTSCGCYQKAIVTKHTEKSRKLYSVWHGMKDRCHRAKHPHYHRYGGRGVTVHEEWTNDYSVFHKWAYENGYIEGLTLDRSDNDGNYTPENCRWVSRKTQANNRLQRNQHTYKQAFPKG